MQVRPPNLFGLPNRPPQPTPLDSFKVNPFLAPTGMPYAGQVDGPTVIRPGNQPGHPVWTPGSAPSQDSVFAPPWRPPATTPHIPVRPQPTKPPQRYLSGSGNSLGSNLQDIIGNLQSGQAISQDDIMGIINMLLGQQLAGLTGGTGGGASFISQQPQSNSQQPQMVPKYGLYGR